MDLELTESRQYSYCADCKKIVPDEEAVGLSFTDDAGALIIIALCPECFEARVSKDGLWVNPNDIVLDMGDDD